PPPARVPTQSGREGWWARRAQKRAALPTLPRTFAFAHDAAGFDRVAVFVHDALRSEEHTSELQSLTNLVCRLLLEKKKIIMRAPSSPAGGGLRATGATPSGAGWGHPTPRLPMLVAPDDRRVRLCAPTCLHRPCRRS